MGKRERGIWEYLVPNGGGDGMTVTARPDGSLNIEVEEEQAVDSYNASVRTSVELPADIAAALVTFLSGLLAAK